MAKLTYLPRFHADLSDIWLYIAQDNPAAADRMVDKLFNRCKLLEDHPEAGPARPDIAPDCRMLVEGRYLILYRIAGQTVELVRALDGAQRLDADHFHG